jgi:hypothetical protein
MILSWVGFCWWNPKCSIFYMAFHLFYFCVGSVAACIDAGPLLSTKNQQILVGVFIDTVNQFCNPVKKSWMAHRPKNISISSKRDTCIYTCAHSAMQQFGLLKVQAILNHSVFLEIILIVFSPNCDVNIGATSHAPCVTHHIFSLTPVSYS